MLRAACAFLFAECGFHLSPAGRSNMADQVVVDNPGGCGLGCSRIPLFAGSRAYPHSCVAAFAAVWEVTCSGALKGLAEKMSTTFAVRSLMASRGVLCDPRTRQRCDRLLAAAGP